MNKELSIIVPMYNAERTIEKCLQSILGQTYSNFELLLVNDGSEDKTLQICEAYAKKDKRIRILSQENKGLIEARKLGVNAATTAVVGFVDSDDWIEEDMYAELMKIYKETGCKLVSSGIYRDYSKDGYTIEVCDHFEEGLYQNLPAEIYSTMLWDGKWSDFGLYCTLVNKLFQREILKEIYYEIDTRVFYGEDCLTLYSYVMRIESLYILKKSFYHYIIWQDSMCRSADEKLLCNTYYLFQGLQKEFQKVNEQETKYALLKQLRRYILEVESHTLGMLYGIDMAAMGEWKYDFPEVLNKKVVLYGAGGGSKALYRYLKDRCNIVAWLDKAPEGKDMRCLHEILPADKIPELDFDYLVISVLSKELAQSIKKELMELYHVQDDKILWQQAEHTSIFENA